MKLIKMPSNIKDIVLFLVIFVIGMTITLYIAARILVNEPSINNSTASNIINSTIINKAVK